MDRRTMLKATGSAAALSILGGIPLAKAGEAGKLKKSQKKKILVIGAHPDDPETGAGGTICLLKEAGHEVVCVYLTRGEAGIPGKSHEEAAAIRVVECTNACAVTGCSHVFMDQVDGATEINQARYKEMRDLLEREKPDVVITHWPIDGHRDHAVCGGCETREDGSDKDGSDIDGWHEAGADKGGCETREDGAVMNDAVMDGWHEPMERFRGIECRCEAAEAFARHTDAQALV